MTSSSSMPGPHTSQAVRVRTRRHAMRHLLEIHCLPVAERLLMSLVMLVALWESVFATLTGIVVGRS